MNTRKFASALLSVLLSLTVVPSAHAEVFESTYSVTKSWGDYEFITELLVGPGVALRPSGHKIEKTENFQIGIFSNLVAQVIPSFTNGVILSNGLITDGPSLENTNPCMEWPNEGVSLQPCNDRDINEYFKENLLATRRDLYDPAGLVLYIQPKNKTINIPFVMASEEFYRASYDPHKPALKGELGYEDWSDKFVFFLQELGTASECLDAEGNVTASAMQNSNEMLMTNNIARLPGGGDVEIASVNQHTNSEYFIPNVELNGEGRLEYPGRDINLPMEFNGAIVGPVAVAEGLDTNKVYKLKLILVDYGDNTLTSVVFLREKGITSGADLKCDVVGPTVLPEAGPVTFTNVVSNIGPATADVVRVTYRLPAGVDKDSVSVECGDVGSVPDKDSWTDNSFVWTIGSRFAPGSNAVMKVSYALSDGTYTNLAVVTTSTGDYDESNNTGRCVTVVGDVRPPLTITAITKTICYGEKVDLSELEFVDSIVGTNGSQRVEGVDVTFTNAQGEVAYPTNGTAAAGAYGIYLSKLRGFDTGTFASVTYQSGTLTVTQAVLTISVSNAEWRVRTDRPAYGIEDFTDQLKPGDTPEQITGGGTLVYTNAFWTGSMTPTDADARTYSDEIWLTRECLVGGKAANYSISIDPGDLTILKQLPKLTISAIETNKVCGAELSLSDLQFIASIDGTNGTQVVTGIDVTFTNDQGEAAWPTNAAAAVGEYGICLANVQGLDTDDFREVAYEPGKLTVKEAVPLVVRAINAEKTYGETISLSDLQFIASIDGTNGTQIAAGIDVAFTNASGEVAYPTNAAAAAGTYGIVLSNIRGFDLGGFAPVTYVPGLLTVAKQKIRITPKDITKTYGDLRTLVGTPKAYTVTDESGNVISLVGGASIRSVTLTSDGSPKTAPWTADGYDILAKNAKGNAALANYEISYGTGTLHVAKYKMAITANEATNAYGAVSHFDGTEFTVNPVSLPNGDQVETVTITNLLPTTTEVGTHADAIVPSHVVAGSQFDTNNYAITFLKAPLTVIKAPLTIRADDTNRVYGTTIDSFTGREFTTDPLTLPNGETVETVAITSTEAADPTADAKAYPGDIVPSQVLTGSIRANNYDITFAKGTLTVKKAPLTIIASGTNRVYGTTIDSFTGKEFTTDPARLPNGETVETVAITSTEAGNAAADAKAYPGDIVPSHDVTGGNNFKTNNYEIAFSNGTLTVTQRPITVLATDATKTYGDLHEFDGTGFVITNGTLAAGETVDKVTLASEGAAEASAAGSYPIVPSHPLTGTNFKTNNYDIVFSNGTLTVTRMAMTITANAATNCYGEASAFTGKEFTVVPTSLPNGDKVETVTLANVRPIDTGVGSYADAIVPSHAVTGISTNNYAITFSNGTLTVTQALLTVSVNDATWRVKKPKPDYSFADFSSLLRAGDTVADITGGTGLASDVGYTNAVWETAVPVKGNEGVYTNEIWIDVATLDGPRAANYLLAIDPGDLTIISAEGRLTVSIRWVQDWDTGLQDATITLRNVGDGEMDADSDYWVELLRNNPYDYVLYYNDRVVTTLMPDGYCYQDLTAAVRSALGRSGNRNAVFEPGETVTITGVSLHQSNQAHARLDANAYVNPNAFFVIGRLFNPADTDRNFRISNREKTAAEALLGVGVAEYLEVTRLWMLPYYHWSTADQTWK